MPPIKRPPRKRQRTYFREWRLHRDKMKQYEAAEALGIDRSTLSRIESGESPYDQDMLEKMAVLYGCNPGDLLAVNPLLPASEVETDVVRLFRQATPETQRIIKTILRTGTDG